MAQTTTTNDLRDTRAAQLERVAKEASALLEENGEWFDKWDRTIKAPVERLRVALASLDKDEEKPQ